MTKDNLTYLKNIRDIISEIKSFTTGHSLTTFIDDAKTNKAVAHDIQIIGEAANQLSPNFRDKYPSVPWKKIIGLRHKIVHDYLDIDLDILWDIVEKDLPVLKEQLSTIIQNLETPNK